MNNQKELILLEDLGMLYPGETSSYKKRYGLYRCACGKEFKTQIASVKNGNTKNCGCTRNKNKITHGLTNHSLYNIWFNMIDRCNNENSNNYKNYGTRGIGVCDRWLKLENFINDMYSGFEYGLTLDRIDVNGNYEPDNCRWVDRKVQQRNQRKLRNTNSSGYRGVDFKHNRWRAQISINYKRIHLGYFNTALDGALAYDNYIINNNLEHTRNFS